MAECLDGIRKSILDSIEIKKLLLEDAPAMLAVLEVSELLVEALARGNRIFFAGNGGSAADAQHLAAELVSRFEFDRPGLPALSLATDTSMLTAIGNDYGYERLFARQLQAQARTGDLFIGITTSGRSKNIIAAFGVCVELGVTAVALCGQGGDLDSIVDKVIRVPSAHTARIQECHIVIGHALCEHVERRMFGHLAPK